MEFHHLGCFKKLQAIGLIFFGFLLLKLRAERRVL